MGATRARGIIEASPGIAGGFSGRPRRHSDGRAFTLVEALVAMAVLGAGVLGVLGTFSLCGSTASENQRLAQAVTIAQRELAMAVNTKAVSSEGGEQGHRWKVQRQDQEMGLIRVAVTVSWQVRGTERTYVLEQLCLKAEQQ